MESVSTMSKGRKVFTSISLSTKQPSVLIRILAKRASGERDKIHKHAANCIHIEKYSLLRIVRVKSLESLRRREVR